ncbi:MAG TPA: 23S rRNA (guanosine(2251)-2'-O)-methyltransferase RlmB [Acidimicrobiia bacterium]|nr:23S rRNA (guanosine(2251)-2'-O)-methyltransferase RlmB [Acidimicrobiia bacterium]
MTPRLAASSLGGDRVEGRRAVTELLTAGRRRVRTVWVASERSDDLAEIADNATRRGIQVREVTRQELDDISSTEVPQGVVADADPIEPAGVDEMLAVPSAFLVALDGVTDPQNLGAVLRAAETAGATGIVLPRHRAAHLTPAAVKAAAGAIEYLPIAAVAGIPAVIIQAARADVWTIGLDADGDVPIDDLTIADRPLMLVLGAEGRGLSRLARERCDVVARIPMYGHVASLNVGAAAAITCATIARLRTATL